MHTSLNDMPRKNAFKVPEGYFEELPTAVLLKCSVSKVEKSPLSMSKPLWWSVAACGLLLLGIWFVVPNSTPSSQSLLTENTLVFDVDCWDSYLAYHISSAVIEEELFSSNIEFSMFLEELTEDDFLDYDDLITYSNYDDYDIY
ncbi:MAG: hypothetical protein FWG79_07320 [Bacteroidales bacterium]|nr:hypothetical protein [Bacteroidales bacterium]